jgi:hypothetical protein
MATLCEATAGCFSVKGAQQKGHIDTTVLTFTIALMSVSVLASGSFLTATAQGSLANFDWTQFESK